MNVPLEQWLKCAVPLESRCHDLTWSKALYQLVVARTLSHGTTTAVYFGSVHGDACSLLAVACVAGGQRALVGKVCMDNTETCGCGKGAAATCRHVQTTQVNIEETRAFLEGVRLLGGRLVEGICTPRFVPSCSPALLDGLGEVAREFDVAVQTHAWESNWQVQFGIANRGGRDLDILRGHGLVTGRPLILAHAVHANDDEIAMMALTSSSVAVAHCPLSNAFFADGIMPAKKMLDAGVCVGLGTDVGGAWSSSILNSCQHAVICSRILQDGTGAGGHPAPDAAIDHVDAFWMATVGGNRALGRNHSLRSDSPFDALIISSTEGNVDVWPELDSIEDSFQKFMMMGDDRNIRQVWVDGRCCVNKDITSTKAL